MRKITFRRVKMYLRMLEYRDFSHKNYHINPVHWELKEDTLYDYMESLQHFLHLKKKGDIDQLEHHLRFIIAKRKLTELLEDKPKVHIGYDPAKGKSVTARMNTYNLFTQMHNKNPVISYMQQVKVFEEMARNTILTGQSGMVIAKDECDDKMNANRFYNQQLLNQDYSSLEQRILQNQTD